MSTCPLVALSEGPGKRSATWIFLDFHSHHTQNPSPVLGGPAHWSVSASYGNTLSECGSALGISYR